MREKHPGRVALAVLALLLSMAWATPAYAVPPRPASFATQATPTAAPTASPSPTHTPEPAAQPSDTPWGLIGGVIALAIIFIGSGIRGLGRGRRGGTTA